jgi:hypothetical protein
MEREHVGSISLKGVRENCARPAMFGRCITHNASIAWELSETQLKSAEIQNFLQATVRPRKLQCEPQQLSRDVSGMCDTPK